MALGVLAIGWSMGWHPLGQSVQSRARDLEAHGTPVQARTIRVHIERDSPDPFAATSVQDVQVRLPGVAGGRWLALAGTGSPELHDEDAGKKWFLGGWQAPNDATSYTSPLDVRYMVAQDGGVSIMAQDDIWCWLTEDTSTNHPGLLSGGALIGLSFTLVVGPRLRRRRAFGGAGAG